jgi:DNA-binding transcriptional ArsR family regulator
MVEYVLPLDTIFASLADPTRRDILERLQLGRMNVTDIAEPYDMSLAAVSKHLKILEQAKLVMKRRKGKEQIVSLQPQAFTQGYKYLKQYEQLWNDRLDRLELYLEKE